VTLDACPFRRRTTHYSVGQQLLTGTPLEHEGIVASGLDWTQGDFIVAVLCLRRIPILLVFEFPLVSHMAEVVSHRNTKDISYLCFLSERTYRGLECGWHLHSGN
jgi:hypothetical protein